MSLSGKYNFPVTTEAQADDVPAGSIKPELKAWQAEQVCSSAATRFRC